MHACSRPVLVPFLTPSPSSLVDPRDRKHFYFIVNDPRMGFAYCHVLQILGPTDRLPACMG